MNLKSVPAFLISLIATVVILIYCKSLLVPFVFALLLWVLVRKLTTILNKVKVARKLPSWIKTIFSSVIIIALVGLLLNIVVNSIAQLAVTYTNYEANLNAIIGSINNTFGIDIVMAGRDLAVGFDFGTLLTTAINSLTDILSNAFMIILYALFIFFEEANFQKKLRVVFEHEHQYDKIACTLAKVEKSVSDYLGVKTLLSLLTGLLSYAVMAIVGVDSAVFWAFIIFLLNYIPTVGSLLATMFPVIFCLLQFGDFANALIVLVLVGAIQVLVGNILEPKLMGNSLNISSLIAIIALTLWGIIWGVMGMILSIPITVIIIIVLSQFDKTKPIAIMLSEKGQI